MNYKIIKKETFTVLEKIETHTVSEEQNLNTIPNFWGRSHRDGTIKTLRDRASEKTCFRKLLRQQSRREVYPDGDMTSKNYKSYIGIPVVNE